MSSIVYHRKSSTLRDAFLYQNVDGTFGTGFVQADFTIKLSKDGTGNQSTSGVTITEVDATNNPGEYEVEVASSAFVASNGTYVLTITKTSAPIFTFEQVYVVNDTGASTSTPASFTATSGDGRVTDGSSGIDDATVYLTLSGSFYTQTTTDSNGDWGPVYLSDGTYTVYVQATGYAQATATITVSGATVTGPGSNIVLTAGSTADPLSAAQLWAYARRQAADLTGTKADAIIKGAVNDALDMVSSEKEWPFLLRKGYLTLNGAYTTGTITLTDGDATVTLASGTWPTWAASGKIYVSGQVFDVLSRTSGSAIELTTDFNGTTTSGLSYVIYQNQYDLPDDFWRFHETLPGTRWGWGARPESIANVLAAENSAAWGQPFPSLFAIAYQQFVCWPYPSTDANYAYTYYARPSRLTQDTDIADWDPVHLECLKRAIDYQLARQLGKIVSGDANTTMAAYREAVSRDKVQDKSPTSLPPVGHDYRVGLSRQYDWKRLI